MFSYAEIINDIQNEKYAPVYLLQGEETFFIDNIISHIEENALDETQKNLNQIILYGKDTSLTEVIGAARRYPMMGERQVVIVKEAQELKGWTNENIQLLVTNYLENPLPSTILVFGYKYKSLDKRTKLGKNFDKHTVFLHAKKLYDNEVSGWVQEYCSAKKVEIEKDAIMMLSENIGNNLQRLANEIEKLILNLKEGAEISSMMVQKYVGISKEYNIFELQKALGMRSQQKVHKIINYFASNPSNNPMVLTIYNLFTYFSKLLLVYHSQNENKKVLASVIGVSPYFVDEYVVAARNYPIGKVIMNITHIQQADLQSKGIGSATKKDGAVLTELVHKLMN